MFVRCSDGNNCDSQMVFNNSSAKLERSVSILGEAGEKMGIAWPLWRQTKQSIKLHRLNNKHEP